VKAIFGGAVKKPLMTKVSMRHLNEIVRERNQYSRDAQEAWQDFINLKGRMDTELGKVTKRNNFLVEELESWKQQFLKFQTFAEQLTKETQDLKVKIENHKRENRRLSNLIDQQKDDAARLTIRLSGTEKQRDDALEALVLQQEIAEELERERKKNKKELAALQHTNGAILRQRDETQRVVLHLRALIEGQTHHMEHIVKSLNQDDVSNYMEGGFADVPEEDEEDFEDAQSQRPQSIKDKSEVGTIRGVAGVESRQESRASTAQGKHFDGEDVTPDMEQRLYHNPARNSKRFSNQSMVDVADRVLRDKTDAIAYIIRNISEQCAAAVEGLQLAQRADTEDGDNQSDRRSSLGQMSSAGGRAQSTIGSEYGEEESMLRPGRGSSIPPTPDLSHRSSTSMSMASASTTPDRSSLQHRSHDIPVVPTRIIEDDDDVEGNGDLHPDMMPVSKYAQTPLQRSSTAVRHISR
jgi:DNA-binding transcriptional regulator YbjK